jgi:hypothetical protein
MGEPAQFKARLKFRRAQQPVKNDLQMSFNSRSMTEDTRNSEVMRRLTKIAIGATESMRVSTTKWCHLMVNGA